MDATTTSEHETARLRCAIVLTAAEDVCHVIGQAGVETVGYSPAFPTPRVERVAPGHRVALASASDTLAVVVWRWYDAVVLGEQDGQLRLWEPAHGEVLAQSRRPEVVHPAGSRAYLSAGLPGADWWVAGAVVTRPEDADVELVEVEQFLTRHDLWGS